MKKLRIPGLLLVAAFVCPAQPSVQIAVPDGARLRSGYGIHLPIAVAAARAGRLRQHDGSDRQSPKGLAELFPGTILIRITAVEYGGLGSSETPGTVREKLLRLTREELSSPTDAIPWVGAFKIWQGRSGSACQRAR